MDLSPKGERDSTFWISQKQQKILRTSCEILHFACEILWNCGICGVDSVKLPFWLFEVGKGERTLLFR